jgi:hypothetical protein
MQTLVMHNASSLSTRHPTPDTTKYAYLKVLFAMDLRRFVASG